MKMDSCSTFHFLESSSNSSSLVETSWNVLAMTKKESAVSCLNCAISNSFSKLKFEQIETKEGMREERNSRMRKGRSLKLNASFSMVYPFFFSSFFFLIAEELTSSRARNLNCEKVPPGWTPFFLQQTCPNLGFLTNFVQKSSSRLN